MKVIFSNNSNASDSFNMQWTHETCCALVVQSDSRTWILYDQRLQRWYCPACRGSGTVQCENYGGTQWPPTKMFTPLFPQKLDHSIQELTSLFSPKPLGL